MPVEFELPDVGEGVAEGELITWQVAPGDDVTEDQVLAEVETDKALVDVPSPVDGTVRELHATEGEVVPVGDVLVTIDTAEDVDEEAVAVEPEAGDGADAAEAATEDDEVAATGKPGGRVFAPPSVRSLARELGVELGAVEGSGPGGRVTEGDVRAAAEAAEPGAEAETGGSDAASEAADVTSDSGTEATAAQGTTAGEAADRNRTLAAPATRGVAQELDVDIDAVPTDETRDGEPFVSEAAVREYAEAQQAAQAADAEALAAGEAGEASEAGVAAEEREERVPYRGVRRTIGEAMERSKYTAPHVSHHDSVEVSALVEAKETLAPEAEERGVKLTYMPFVLKAVVAALEDHPELNASLDEENDEIVRKRYYNVGVATATDAGLMVPVVKSVDEKGLFELAGEVRDLVDRARERTIQPEEMQGGTFSITNFGAIGGEYATPILNYPEAAILGLGAIEQRPWVEDGEVVARPVLPLSLSIDHRIVDGAEAAAFTNTLKEYLAEPLRLLA